MARNTFTTEDDDFLAQYIAKYNPQLKGRSGNILYRTLVENEEGLWPWAKRHSWHSWRDRYVKNSGHMDKRIARYVKLGRNHQPATPRKFQPATPAGSQAKRAAFTKEDDQHIVDFLADAPPSLGTRKGQKLWMALVDDLDKYPWAQRRGWQSWRERYLKNAAYFDRAVAKQVRGDESGDEDDEPAITPPRTVEDHRVHRRPSQHGLPENRKRVSNSTQDAPPRKKKRVQVADSEDEQPEAGPSRHRDADPEEAAEDEDEHQPDFEQEAEEDAGPDANESHREDNDDDEDGGPVGPDEYRGEIFEYPDRTKDAADAVQAALSDSSEEQQELFNMLTDDPRPDTQDDLEMDVDEAGEQTMVEVAGEVHDDAAEAQPATSRSSPPALRHHQRIVRDLGSALGTPPLSPTDEAQARHRLEHGHSPAPSRKHVPRIRRPADEEFFGTPQSKTTSTSGTAVSSPTADRVAHVRQPEPVEDDDEDDARPRAPPRLDEGAWTKAFSDVRGKSRVSGSGRRKSGVDFEDEVQDIPGSPSRHDDDDDGDGDVAEAIPVPWPPVRHKDKTVAPSTPVAGRVAKDKGKARADAEVDRTVRTEKIVSVKTVRTVERRIPRASNGTPYVRGALFAARDEEESGEQEEQEDPDPEPSQHHPFSQPVFPPKMAASVSNRSNPPVPKSDVSRLQRLLSGHLKKALQSSPSKAERDSRPPTTAQSAVRMGNHVLAASAIPPRVREAPSRETISPPGVVRDDSAERFEQFEERDEELPGPVLPEPTSPLAGRGEKRSLQDYVPQASSSRTIGANPILRADKGKERASGTSHATGHARRHTLAGPEAFDMLPSTSRVVDMHLRRSMPSAFTIGDDLPRSALNLLFNPARSDSAHQRSHSLGRRPGSRSSRSISPYMFADAAAAKRLPPNELDLVLEIGISQAFRIMAENHGFGESTVRDVFAATGSLEQTDRLLCRMRESANKTANEVLQSLDRDDKDDDDEDGADADEGGDGDGANFDEDNPEVADEDDHQSEGEEDTHSSRRPAWKEEQLEDDSWMQDDAPLAESSRFVDPSHSRRGSSFGADSRRRQSLLIKRIPPDPPSPANYSPPKRTRAAKVVRHSLSRAPEALRVDFVGATTGAGSPDVGHTRPSVAELAKFSNDQWRRLGTGGAKVATGKAVARLLR
ncbi:hypothetical protein K466DRAFT_655640 [Polyporus arcularius HHB13444]|uniref:TERF2-interacting telomeric protein 1 Myb domain-containing protein n=1 Tax=Polyporus arcularius HHB13444 TaxID=1314778 RepID=A0A5C3P2R6_9APHY|nr:hypothetical protein K466DRAFT_655640 [Polyporus arcularius HHB13444]